MKDQKTNLRKAPLEKKITISKRVKKFRLGESANNGQPSYERKKVFMSAVGLSRKPLHENLTPRRGAALVYWGQVRDTTASSRPRDGRKTGRTTQTKPGLVGY